VTGGILTAASATELAGVLHDSGLIG